MTEDQLPKPEVLDREARRLEKLRSLRVVQVPRDDELAAPVELDYEPEDAA